MTNTKIYPAQNSYLIGQNEAEQVFLKAYNSQTLHHGLILSGEEGIGKATLAYKIARFLIHTTYEKNKTYTSLDIPTNSMVFKQIESKSHPDFKVLERDFTETDKKKLIKAIKDGDTVDEEMRQNLKRSSVIKVEDVRDVVTFLSKKSFNDNWRIVLVDSADDLNVSSANALLKILEEPPLKSMLILISHNMEKLLPTIRSRCAKITLKPLQTTEVASLLRRYAPNLDEKTVKGLAEISKGSIGRALRYAENNALEMYETIQKICYNSSTNPLTGVLSLELANIITADEDYWDLFKELMFRFVRENLAKAQDYKQLYTAYEGFMKIIDETVRLNMDKKQATLAILSLFTKDKSGI